MSAPDNLPGGADGDEQCTAIARRERIERLRRGSVWFLAVMLLAVLVGLMIGRVVRDQIPWGGTLPPREAPAGQPLLALEPAFDRHSLTLRLQLARPVRYQRIEQGGAVILRLADVQLPTPAQAGRVQLDGGSLAWRVEAQGADVQVLLVGLGARLQVRQRLQPLGEHWSFQVEAALPQ